MINSHLLSWSMPKIEFPSFNFKEKAERLLREAKEKTKRLAVEAKEKAEKLAIEAKEKTERLGREAKEKAEKLAIEAKEKSKRLALEAKEKSEELSDKAQILIFKKFTDKDLINKYKTNIKLFKSKTLTEVKNKELLTQRFKNVELHQQKLGRSRKPLKIAICASGGGYRAMTSVLGFLKGLEEIEVLDSVLYIASLSGSTWGTARWIEDIQKELDKTIKDVKNKIISNPKISNKYSLRGLNDTEFKAYADNLLIKLAYRQPVSKIIEYYGSSVATNIFKSSDRILTRKLSKQKTKLVLGEKPLPIYTSIIIPPKLSLDNIDSKLIVSEKLILNPYKWVEYTPWYVGLPELNDSYFSTEFFGTKFDSNFNPSESVEPSLALMLGIFGSAFSASINYLLKDLPEKLKREFNNIITGQALKLLLEVNPITNARVAVADINNFINNKHKKHQDPTIRELCAEKTLKLADAGLEFNLPLPPLLHRQVDLILVCDATSDSEGQEGSSLLEAYEYAKRHKLPFPDHILDPKNLDNKFILNKENLRNMIYELQKEPTIYHHLVLEEPNKPTIIYFPFVGLIGDGTAQSCLKADCGTLNFGYTEKIFDHLINFMSTKVNLSKDIIIDKIRNIKN